MTCPPNALADGVDLVVLEPGGRLVGHLDARPGRRPDVRVLELWRYPVKSLQGERLTAAAIGALGIAGDRQWALFDRDTGLGLTARRVPELLFGSARLRADGGVEVVLPDGTVTADDAVLSDWLGRRVELRAAAEHGDAAPTYETPGRRRAPTPTEWLQWEGAPGPFHDSPRIRLSLVSTGTLGHLGPAPVPGQRRPGRRGRGRAARARGAASATCGCGSACPIAALRHDHPPAARRHRPRHLGAQDHPPRARRDCWPCGPPSSSPGTVRTGDVLEPA